MHTSRRLSLALIAGAVALLLVGAEAQQAERPHFVKVGPHRINVDRIAFTRDRGDALIITFSGDRLNRLQLEGAEAEAMRRWLDERIPDLMAPRHAKVIMEGVDINTDRPHNPTRRPTPEVDPR
jgi:hypothetical protein